MREARYYFGRLNLIAQYQNKRDFLLSGLRTRKTIEAYRHAWGFFDISEIGSGQNQFITGLLVKLRPESEEEIADLETHELTSAELQNQAVAKARFFLHVRTGLIAYHPVSGYISAGQFVEHFVRLFKEGHDNFFVDAEIQAVEERYRLLDELARFEAVFEVIVSLHPTNPNFDPIYERTDRRLRALEATSYTEIYRGNPELSPHFLRGRIGVNFCGFRS
jgi:hypothetical protein